MIEGTGRSHRDLPWIPVDTDLSSADLEASRTSAVRTGSEMGQTVNVYSKRGLRYTIEMQHHGILL